jgi:hypothetical protein
MADYYQLLERIHRLLRPRTYVEIGFRNGRSFALARTAEHSVAIDPAPDVRFALPPGGKLFALTSDEFFDKHDLRAELGNHPVDLAFIDGMHLFEFALRDFINLEKYCTASSTILIHDGYPQDAVSAARERTTMLWSGDVWKLVLCLKRYRPDLSIATADAPPTGLVIVRKLNPASTIVTENLEAICAEFISMRFEDIAADKARQLNRVPNDWHQLRRLFPEFQDQGLLRRWFGR